MAIDLFGLAKPKAENSKIKYDTVSDAWQEKAKQQQEEIEKIRQDHERYKLSMTGHTTMTSTTPGVWASSYGATPSIPMPAHERSIKDGIDSIGIYEHGGAAFLLRDSEVLMRSVGGWQPTTHNPQYIRDHGVYKGSVKELLAKLGDKINDS